jgi:hypothetical protein
LKFPKSDFHALAVGFFILFFEPFQEDATGDWSIGEAPK